MNTNRIFIIFSFLVCTLCAPAQVAKYVFFFIGDGMGVNQVVGSEMYAAEQNGTIGTVPLCFTRFPYTGLSKTYSKTNSVTDSAAGGTALSTGYKTGNGVLGMDSACTVVLKTIAEKAAETGRAVGMITTVSIDHATPAAFYAHVPKRNMYYTIGRQLARSGFDFFAGAGFLQPRNPENEKDPDLYSVVADAGYTVLRGMETYREKGKESEKVILLPGEESPEKSQASLPFAIDRGADDVALRDLTAAGVDFLTQKDKGFFLMVEGGKIDWACHSNDAATVFEEVKDMDDAVRIAYDFYRENPDSTLIVITADHETGGLALGNSDYTLNLKVLSAQKLSEPQLSAGIIALNKQEGKKLTWEQMRSWLSRQTGLWDVIPVDEKDENRFRGAFARFMESQDAAHESEYFKVKELATLAKEIINKKAKVGWTTSAHSGAPVPVFAIGVGAPQFTGIMENTEIPVKIANAAGY